MNNIVGFRKCTLSNQELIEAVDKATDELYSFDERRALRRLVRHVPARPNEDYDLIVGELIYRFAELVKASDTVLDAFEHEIDTTLVDERQDKALNALKEMLWPKPTLHLNKEASIQFAEMLANPSEPNEALKEAGKKYKEMLEASIDKEGEVE